MENVLLFLISQKLLSSVFACVCVCYEVLFHVELIHPEAHCTAAITPCRALFFVSEGILLTIHEAALSMRQPGTTRKTKGPINLCERSQSDSGGSARTKCGALVRLLLQRRDLGNERL